MKCFIIVLVSTLLFTGCSKEIPKPDPTEMASQDMVTFQLINLHQPKAAPINVSFSMEEIYEMNTATAKKPAKAKSSNGHISKYYGAPYFETDRISWGVNSTPSGIVTGQISTLGTAAWHFDANCIQVMDSIAVFGGVMTQADPNVTWANVGDYMYFLVIDNGEGNNTPADRFLIYSIYHPTMMDVCDLPLISMFYPWGIQYGLIQTFDNGQVQVK